MSESLAVRTAKNVEEVTEFLDSIGLAHCTDAVLNDGLYLSMRLLKQATFEELLDCRMQPADAKLIMTSLGTAAVTDESAMEASLIDFLGAIGVDATEALMCAGCISISSLRDKSAADLIRLGIRPVHARLITSSIQTVDDNALVRSPVAAAAVDSNDNEKLDPTPATADAAEAPEAIRVAVAAGCAADGAADGAADDGDATSLLGRVQRSGSSKLEPERLKRLRRLKWLLVGLLVAVNALVLAAFNSMMPAKFAPTPSGSASSSSSAASPDQGAAAAEAFKGRGQGAAVAEASKGRGGGKSSGMKGAKAQGRRRAEIKGTMKGTRQRQEQRRRAGPTAQRDLDRNKQGRDAAGPTAPKSS